MENHYRCENCDLKFSSENSLGKHKAKFCSNLQDGLLYASNSWTEAMVKYNYLQEPSSHYHKNIDTLKKQEKVLQKQKRELLKQLEELSGDKNNETSEKEETEISEYNNVLREGSNKYHNDGWAIHRSAKHERKHVLDNVPHETGNKLLHEVRQMFEEYIRNGGNDQNVLDYFSQMERNIETFNEKSLAHARGDGNPAFFNNLEKQVEYYEARNKMLENELQMMQRQDAQPQSKIGLSVNQRRFNEDSLQMLPNQNQIQPYHYHQQQQQQQQHQQQQQQQQHQHQQQQQQHQQHQFLLPSYTTYGVGTFHEQRLMEMRQETEYYRQQLELEHIRQQLYCLRGNPNKPVLPNIGFQLQQPPPPSIEYHTSEYPSITQHANNHQQHPHHHHHQQQQQQQQHIPSMQHSTNYQLPAKNDLNFVTHQKHNEAFQKAPYDPGSGFTLFLDFVSIPDTTSGYFSLLVTMYRGGEKVSSTKSLPVTAYGINQTQPNFHQHFNGTNTNIATTTTNNNSSVAIVGVKQLFPKCLPDLSLSLVVCLCTGTVYSADQITLEHSMKDYGWCKIDLFDSVNCVLSGRWKTPLRSLPVQPDMTTAQLNSVPQVGHAELFYRLVNSRDANTQEATILNAQMIVNYKYAPVETYPLLKFPQLTLEGLSPRKLPTSFGNPDEEPMGQQQKQQQQQQQQHRASVNLSPTTNPLSATQREGAPRATRHPVVQPPASKIRSTTSIKDDSSRTKLPSLIGLQSPIGSHTTIAPLSGAVESVAEVAVPSIECNIGIQLDHIVDLSSNSLKVCLSICNPDGKVGYCDNGETMICSNWVKPSFLKLVQHFGLQETFFSSVQLFRWSVLYVEVLEQNEEMNESLMAWSVLPLFDHQIPNNSIGGGGGGGGGYESSMGRSNASLLTHNLKFGVLRIPLYKPPVFNLKGAIEKMKIGDSSCFVPTLQNSFLCVNFYREEHQKRYQSCAIPHVPAIEQLPKGAWIEHVRDKPTRLFRNGDGFDVYVDGGRYFPDSTMAAKVVIGFFDGSGSKKSPFTSTFETNLSVDMSSMEPRFDARFEFREFAYLPQTKLVFKMYLLNDVTKKVFLYGHCIVPLFVKPDTFEYAGVSSQMYCLNEGAQQLKLYRHLEDTVHFDQNKLKGSIPCSSLLVRILPAACYSDGEPKSSKEIPEDEWINEGILVPMPAYEQGRYDSMQCQPSGIEIELLHHFMTRKEGPVKDKAREAAPEGKKAKTDHGLLEWLKGQFKALDRCTLMDMRFFVKYSTHYGLFFLLRRAQNLPWNGLTLATYCISPPASFYHGVVDDPVMLVYKISEDSLQKHVYWRDDLKIFSRRMHCQNLAIVVQLYAVTFQNGEFKFTQQAWTLIPLMTGGYLLHGLFQIPVFQGSPSESVLSEIQHQPLIPTVTALRKKNVLKIVDGASLFVCTGDPRRLNEDDEKNISVDQTFLPHTKRFLNASQSKPVKTLIPAGIQYDQYIANISIAFDRYIKDMFHRRK